MTTPERNAGDQEIVEIRTDDVAGGGEAETRDSPDSTWDMSPLAATIAELRSAQTRRKYLVRALTAWTNTAKSLARADLGAKGSYAKGEREPLKKQAGEIVDALWAGRPRGAGEMSPAAVALLTLMAEARGPLAAERRNIEQWMERASATLPGYALVEATPGLGAIAFAVVVGECGDLARFPHWRMLWKYAGLAPDESYPAGKNGKRKVPRGTRGEIYGCLATPLLTRKNAYRAAYDEARALLEAREAMTDKHRHAYALRVMMKRLLRDLWGAWRDTESSDGRAQPAPTRLAGGDGAVAMEGFTRRRGDAERGRQVV